MHFVPADRLPSDENERHAVLRTYFCDKDALPSPAQGGWELELAWPTGKDRHVDPALNLGLRWWGGNLDLGDMPFARRREGKILTALYDTWTLHSWSEWLERTGAHPCDGIVILHVDDHRDLGSPRLFLRDGKWLDAVTLQAFDLRAPASVEQSIQSGAVGMGSFMTPFLHLFPQADVRHLCQPPKTSATRRCSFRARTEPDTLLDPGSLRPAIELQEKSEGLGTYLATPDMDTWLAGIGDQPVLLHIDMDYFNNRYDGDSDWKTRSEVLNPDSRSVGERIDALTAALARHALGQRLEDVTIAFSPGFFPAELWREADERLRRGLEEIL